MFIFFLLSQFIYKFFMSKVIDFSEIKNFILFKKIIFIIFIVWCSIVNYCILFFGKIFKSISCRQTFHLINEFISKKEFQSLSSSRFFFKFLSFLILFLLFFLYLVNNSLLSYCGLLLLFCLLNWLLYHHKWVSFI